EKLQDDVFPAHPGLKLPRKNHAPLLRDRAVDGAGRPPEPQGGAPHTDPQGAVGAVGAAMGIGARIKPAGSDEPLLGKIEMENPRAGGRVMRRSNPVLLRELA